MHEIKRIDGGRGFQTGRNVFQIGRNKFYDLKNEIPMKIPELKRSGIGIPRNSAKFCGILRNSDWISQPSLHLRSLT
jgi:hypothetical protein